MPTADASFTTAPRRWLDPPEAPPQPRSPQPWPVALLHSAGPIQVPVGRKQRMFLRLGYAPSHRRLAAPHGVVLAPCLLLVGATVAAAAFTGWHIRALGPAQQLAPEPAYRNPSGSGPARAPDVPAPILAAPPAEPSSARRLIPRAQSSRPPASATLEDPALVLAAVRALHVDRDPQRARALVGSFLYQHPAGSLAEEALAVEVEAAVDHRDPDAALLGAEYLIEYPNGAFAGLAQRAISVPLDR